MNKNKKGFASIILIIALVVIIAGGLGYFAFTQKPNALQTSTTTEQTVTQKSQTAQVANKITITAPTTGSILPSDQQTTIRWTIPSAILDSFPQDFKLDLFLNIQKQGEEGSSIGINDGTNNPRSGSVMWDIPAYISSGSLKFGTYKIVAYLQATPKDQSRMCARSVNKECAPNEADVAVMQRSIQVKGESGWFTIISSGSVKDNNAPIITSLTGPTSLSVGEKGVWLLTASDDTATSLKYGCGVSLFTEMPAPGGGNFMSGSTEGMLSDQYAPPGTFVSFNFTPNKPTTGKDYYYISCNVDEPLPNNGELSARLQKSAQFTVSP